MVASEAVRLNGITGLAITKLDVLSGQSKLKIANEYKLNGSRFSAMPANINEASAVKPVYEELSGWQEEIDGVRELSSLPVQARDYIKRIEDMTGVEAAIISVGPDREETLLQRNPFEKK